MACVEQTVAAFGGVDILINNASALWRGGAHRLYLTTHRNLYHRSRLAPLDSSVCF